MRCIHLLCLVFIEQYRCIPARLLCKNLILPALPVSRCVGVMNSPHDIIPTPSIRSGLSQVGGCVLVFLLLIPGTALWMLKNIAVQQNTAVVLAPVRIRSRVIDCYSLQGIGTSLPGTAVDISTYNSSSSSCW